MHFDFVSVKKAEEPGMNFTLKRFEISWMTLSQYLCFYCYFAVNGLVCADSSEGDP